MASEPDVRIGDYLYRLAEGEYETTGLRPLRERWASIFAGRQNVSGAPGVQNVKDEDLRWVADSFAGGEGQRVIQPGSELSLRSFDRSQAIDFAQTGEMRLARRMEQQGSTGGAVTSVEGNTWTDDVGTSTVVGTDRRLNVVGDAVKVNVALGAGQFQVDFHAYAEAGTTIEGSALVEEAANTLVSGTDIRLKSEGATVRSANQTPAAGQVTVVATLLLDAPATGKATATAKLIVWNQTSGEKVAESRISLEASGGVNATVTGQVSFTAKAGKTYRYKVVCSSLSNAPYVTVDKLAITEGTGTTATWEIKNGVTVVASGTVNMAGITATQKIVSVSVAGGVTYTLRLVRTAGAQRLSIDKAGYQIATMAAPRVLELGKSNLSWLVDATGRILYWNADTAAWTLVATLAGGTAQALAHSDSHEFVAMSDKKVYRAAEPSTGEAYTAALTDAIEGITVGGSRLLILTESTASGTKLYDVGLQATPGEIPTERYAVENTGMGASDDVPQRMAATKNGCVFFANQGPDCWIYTWNGTAGTPLEKLPTGFRARAIAHSGGISYVGGGFPTVDSDGVAYHRPAVFVVDHAATGVAQLDIRLHRDEDPSTRIQAMQLHGTDLYVLCSVASSPVKMRLWRVSLREPVAPFLQHEVTLDQTAAAGAARGLSITEQDTFITWSTGGPWRRTTGYNIAEPAIFTSSRYNFGLTERKRLDKLEVMGLLPAGCSVQVSYEVDDSGVFVPLQTVTSPGLFVVSIPSSTVLFRYMRFQVQLISPSEALTPIVYAVGWHSFLPAYEKHFELLLACFDETSVWRMDGTQARGSEGKAYLFNLADVGALVEFENRYATKDSSRYETKVVSVQNPDAFYLRKGEALVRVVLAELSA